MNPFNLNKSVLYPWIFLSPNIGMGILFRADPFRGHDINIIIVMQKNHFSMQKSDYQNHLNSIASYSWLASITFVLTSFFYSFAFLPALEYALLCSYPAPVSGNTSRSSIQQLITNPSIIINALFVTYVIVTLCWILTLDIYNLPELVFSLFFNGTYVR